MPSERTACRWCLGGGRWGVQGSEKKSSVSRAGDPGDKVKEEPRAAGGLRASIGFRPHGKAPLRRFRLSFEEVSLVTGGERHGEGPRVGVHTGASVRDMGA